MNITAEKFCALGAELPELHIRVEGVDLERNDLRVYDHLRWLQQNAIYEVIGQNPEGMLLICGHAGDGIIYDCRYIQPLLTGKYKIKTNRGDLTYNSFMWHSGPVELGWRRLIQGHFRYMHSGNIQYGFLDYDHVRKAAESLPFEYDHGQFKYTGELDRQANVYKSAVYPTYGVTYKTSAYPGARENESCGGYMWPDEATAQAVCDAFVKTGEKGSCWNLKALEAQFPDHPVIPKVRRIARKQNQDSMKGL